MKYGPGVSRVDYFTMTWCERGKQLVDEALTGKRQIGNRDWSVMEQRPRPPCQIGKDACDQLSFPKVTVTLHIFSMLIFIAVSEASKFLFALEAWGTTHQI